MSTCVSLPGKRKVWGPKYIYSHEINIWYGTYSTYIPVPVRIEKGHREVVRAYPPKAGPDTNLSMAFFLTVLWTRDVYPGYDFFFVPDPGSSVKNGHRIPDPWSGSATKSLSFLTQIIVLSSWIYDPGCLLRIPDPDFFPSRIPDPGSTSQKSIKGKLLHTTVHSWGARTRKIVGKTLIPSVCDFFRTFLL